jgi:cysteinyl-tRNA synthetase
MHKLRIFDNLSKEKVELEIEKGKSVNIYLCGPTVYDHVHIGNMRGVLVFDVIHRFLSSLEAEVNYVHNITDIDDKIIEKSHKIGKSEREISQNYAKKYLDNLINYNILFPKFIPKVTNFLSEIKNFIGLLLKNGFAYKNKDSEIIFSIDKAYEDYGKLSGQIIDNLKSKRKLIETDKKNSLDFTL